MVIHRGTGARVRNLVVGVVVGFVVAGLVAGCRTPVAIEDAAPVLEGVRGDESTDAGEVTPTSLVTLGATIEGLEPPEGTVALTFDDGPSPRSTPQILDILDRYDATATFFVVGSLAARHPELVTEIVARGHAVEAHSWSHAVLTQVSDEQLHAEVIDTHDLVTDLTGVQPACVRPPEGKTDDALDRRLARLGVAGLLWTVDTLDWTRPGPATIVSRALRVRDQGVILLHDGGGDRTQTVAALPAILEGLGRRGTGTAQVCGPPNVRPPWAPAAPADVAHDPSRRTPPSSAPPSSMAPDRGRDDPAPPPDDPGPLPTPDDIPTLPGP